MPCNGLVGTRFSDLHLAGDGIPRTNRRLEAPVYLQEHSAGTWQIFGDDCVENCARDTALDHDASETGRLCNLFIIVQGITVTTDLSE